VQILRGRTEISMALTGTWVSIEIQKALQLGYEVLEVYEVMHFENKSTELFKEYVNTFLRSKQESSDYPKWVQTDNDRAQYIQNYFEHEGISLRPERIQSNGGLRAISKSCLNSLWGKYCQRENKTNSELVFESKRFFEIAHNAEYELHDFFILNEHVAEVIFSKKDELCKESPSTNIFIGTFTTAYARLELYRLLEKYQERVLYCDTDSAILIERDNDPEDFIQLSDYLGGLTDEILKDHGANHYIEEFISCGPKNYAYKVTDGSCKVKIKGFTLNYKNAQKLNFYSLKQIVSDLNQAPKITIVNDQIRRDPRSRKIYTKKEEKKYQLVFDKRLIINGGAETRPHGFFWQKPVNCEMTKHHATRPINTSSLLLFSTHHISAIEPDLGELFISDTEINYHDDIVDNDATEIDLMNTSDEDDDEEDDEPTMEDQLFLNDDYDDDESDTNDVSFYRALNNNEQYI